MAIEIKEYIGASFSIQENVSASTNHIALTEANTYSNKIAKNSLMVDIEGLHSVITRNDTLYTDKAMIKSEKLWTNPYEIPVIMHHDEEKGTTIGRVKHAYWTDKNTRSNTGALRFITNIAHKEGIEGIKNGTLSTVSVGILADEVRCSICNQDIATYGMCEHEKGAYYDDKKCYWIVNSFEPKELSFVIVPSDQYAHIINVYEPEKVNLKESTEVNKMDTWMDLIQESESVISLSESKKDETEKEKKDKEVTEETEAVETKEEEQATGTTTETTTEETEVETETKEETVETTEETKTEETKITEETAEKTEEKAQEETQEEDKKAEPSKKEIEEEVKKDKETDIKVEDTDIYKNMKVALDAVKSENEILKKEIEGLKAKLVTEVKLKESAENQVIQMKTEQKRVLVKKINDLRESVNFDREDEETLMKSNEETLNMTIKTLKEFSTKVGALSIPKVESKVAITEAKDNTQKNITEKVKNYIINGQDGKVESKKLKWSNTFLNKVNIEYLYNLYLSANGDSNDIEKFAEYITLNAPIPNNWEELFEKELYDTCGKEVSRLEPLGNQLYKAYVIIDGKEVPYVIVCSRTGYFHG